MLKRRRRKLTPKKVFGKLVTAAAILILINFYMGSDMGKADNKDIEQPTNISYEEQEENNEYELGDEYVAHKNDDGYYEIRNKDGSKYKARKQGIDASELTKEELAEYTRQEEKRIVDEANYYNSLSPIKKVQYKLSKKKQDFDNRANDTAIDNAEYVLNKEKVDAEYQQRIKDRPRKKSIGTPSPYCNFNGKTNPDDYYTDAEVAEMDRLEDEQYQQYGAVVSYKSADKYYDERGYEVRDPEAIEDFENSSHGHRTSKVADMLDTVKYRLLEK